MKIKKMEKENINIPARDLPMAEEKLGDFRSSFHWRIFRILAEFVSGFQFLADFRRTVTVFGSAQVEEDNHWYKESQKLASLLSTADFGVVTGGGPGIMEAANRGAVESNGDSIGLNIELPSEQRVNPFVQKSVGFHYFFVRKVMLAYSAQAYVFFPGGFGTLDEFFELITLVQTKKIFVKIPIVMIGKEFWSPLFEWIKTDVYGKFNFIGKEDMRIYSIVDSAEEAFEIIKNSPERKEF
ncbi:MAG: TIGR00730 family Rossman fold protein [Patescibacteria group bacterium]